MKLKETAAIDNKLASGLPTKSPDDSQMLDRLPEESDTGNHSR